ncbi:MAG: hypothetical protein BGO08_04685 [Altererythrobacter sp. 66-12]|nr:MAG: hypothetical protein BGO08_04685 [Altererythrobacter sp. 66-12]
MASVMHRLLRLRIFIALILGITALQAVPAKPLSLHPDNGPAVSASSVEMALPVRRPMAADLRIAPLHPPLPPVMPAPVPLAENAGGPRLAWPIPDHARAPPRRVLAAATPPRGPPLA